MLVYNEFVGELVPPNNRAYTFMLRTAPTPVTSLSLRHSGPASRFLSSRVGALLRCGRAAARGLGECCSAITRSKASRRDCRPGVVASAMRGSRVGELRVTRPG